MKPLIPLKEPLKEGWSYDHSFGRVTVGDSSSLVITDRKYWRGESWGYNYFVLEPIVNHQEATKKIADLNEQFGLPAIFDNDDSQELLCRLQELFPEAKITNSDTRPKIKKDE